MRTGRRAGAMVALGVGIAACGARTDLDTALTVPALVTACTKLLSCSPPALAAFTPGYTSISDCLWVNVNTFAPWTRPPGSFPDTVLDGRFASTACLAAAPSCAAVNHCVGGDLAVDCSAVPLGGTCIGDRQVICDHGHPVVTDCGAVPSMGGAHCFRSEAGSAICGIGTCSGPSTSCDGDAILSCDSGVLTRGICPVGTTCGALAPNGPAGVGCVSGGSSCGVNPYCDGDVYVSCEARTDCSTLAIQGTCWPPAMLLPNGDLPASPCIPSPQLECNPETHADRCDGTRLVYCDGEERSIDCAALGFRTCGKSRGYAACE